MKPSIEVKVMTGGDCMDRQYPELYQETYGNDEYRREGRKAPNGKLYTLDEYQQMKTNGECLEGYEMVYPTSKVQEMYTESVTRKGYIELRAYVGDELVGVLQGWGCDDSGMEKKLSLQNQEDLAEALGANPNSRHYLAEVFVKKSYQGKGILSMLLNEYYSEVERLGYTSILTRTTQNKPQPQGKFMKDGFKKIGGYPESDQRRRALFVNDNISGNPS